MSTVAISLPYQSSDEFETALDLARQVDGRIQFLVQTSSHFLVAAADPQQAIDWLDGDLELESRSFGHRRHVLLPDGRESCGLRGYGEDAYQATFSAYPLGGFWSPAAWPARTCAPRVRLLSGSAARADGSPERSARAAAR